MGVNCDGPLIAAAIHDLARRGRFKLSDHVYEVLKLPGKFVNPGIKKITVRSLLNQKPWQPITYDWLRQVIVKTSKNNPVAYYRRELFQPNDARAMTQIAAPGSAEARGVPAVWNAHAAWPVCASAPALCRFMHFFRWDGEPRKQANPVDKEFWWGQLPGGLSLMMWRPDGIDAVVLFNGGGSVAAADLVRELGAVIDNLKIAETKGAAGTR
jgi:hypothetical protein